MPEGRQGKNATPLEVQQYKARRHAKAVYPKQQHVDARKRAIGACATCARAVLPGTEPAFEFNHLDEATKCKGGLFGPQGGVGGLVGNDVKAAALDQVQETTRRRDGQVQPAVLQLPPPAHVQVRRRRRGGGRRIKLGSLGILGFCDS